MSDANALPTAPLSLALVHYPIYNKNRDVVRGSVTTIDIHDFARNSRTFGVERCYIVTPVALQQDLIKRLAGHWQEGFGSTYNPTRKDALSGLEVVNWTEDAIKEMTERHGEPPLVVATSASMKGKDPEKEISFAQMREYLRSETRPVLLLFGTGWGMTEDLFALSDKILSPIVTPYGFNHLPVRSACAIILDRLVSA